MHGLGQSRIYDSNLPLDTCIRVVYVVSLFKTGLVESISYSVLSEMLFCAV